VGDIGRAMPYKFGVLHEAERYPREGAQCTTITVEQRMVDPRDSCGDRHGGRVQY